MVAGTERIRRPVAWKKALAIAAARAGDPDFAGSFGARLARSGCRPDTAGRGPTPRTAKTHTDGVGTSHPASLKAAGRHADTRFTLTSTPHGLAACGTSTDQV